MKIIQLFLWVILAPFLLSCNEHTTKDKIVIPDKTAPISQQTEDSIQHATLIKLAVANEKRPGMRYVNN